MTKQDAGELLDLILQRAEGLRAAGIIRVDLGGGAGFTLAAPEPEPDDLDSNQDDVKEVPDALHDPWTHGVPARPGAPEALPRRSRRL